MDLSLILKLNKAKVDCSENESTKRLQKDMSEILEKKYLYEFKTKIDMPRYRETGYINLDKTNEFAFIKKPAKLKEAVYNSIALTFLTYPKVLKPGDYITSKPSYRDGDDQEWTYLVRSEPVREYKHDEVFATKCPFTIKAVINGVITETPISVFDNKTMIRDSKIGAMESDTTTTWIFFQDNETTRHFGVDVDRVIINGANYKFLGRGDRLSFLDGVGVIGIENDDKDYRDDMVNGIAYNGHDSSFVIEEIVGTNNLLFDIDEKYIAPANCSWSVTDKDVTVTTVSGRECMLRIPYNLDRANDTFILKANMSGKEISKKIKIIE